jgi:DNA-binding MarR family transcriptional regulator
VSLVKSSSSPKAGAPRRTPRAPYLVKELERALRIRIDALVESLGLTAIQYTALSVLSGHRGMTSAQLARRSFVSPQAANEMVAGLERRGLIRRKADREGGRALWIFPTALGERTLARCDELVDALEGQMFEDVSRQDEERFRRLLRTCRDALRPGDGETEPARHARLKTAT